MFPTHPRLQSVAVAILATLALLPATASHAIVRRDDVADQSYIDYGLSTQFSCVGGLRLNGVTGTIGSGVLVSSQWVLTAAHCIYNTNNAVNFTLFDPVTKTDVVYTADSEIQCNYYIGDAATTNGYGDIGLVHLSTPVPSSIATPASFFTGSNENGQNCSLVGFGRKGTGLTGELNNASNPGQGAGTTIYGGAFNYKRAGTNVVSSASNGILQTVFNPPPAGTSLECSLGSGDSGGGMFIQVAGQWKLAGINSNGDSNGFYGETNGYARISDNLPWIAQNMAVPESGSFVLLLLGGTGILALRRLRK